MQSRNLNRTGFRITISRAGGIVSSVVGNGVDNLTVSGGNTGDFIHTTPFNWTKTLTGYGIGTVHTTEVYQGKIYNIDSFGVVDTGGASVLSAATASNFTSEAVNQAQHKLYSKLDSGLNLAVDVLEGGKTIAMLRNTLKFRSLLSDFFRNLVVPRRNRKRGARKGLTPGQVRLDYATSKWLEYRYGWYPIYSSIYQAMEELQKSFRTDNALTLYAQHTIEKSASSKSGLGTFQNPIVFTETKGSARARYVMNFCVPPEASPSDWTSLNPVGIAWELLPLSFVADWFFDVGGYLEELETYVKYRNKYRFGQLTVTTKTTSTTKIDGITNAGYSYFLNGTLAGGTGISSVHKKATYYRSSLNRVVSGFPFPRVPSIQAKLNSFRLLDAAALIQQVLVKGLSR